MKKFAGWLVLVMLAAFCFAFVACSAGNVKVSFDSDGGSAVQEQTIEKGAYAEEPAAPQKVGYTFEKWTLDGEEFKFDSMAVESDITLKAAWKANTDTKYYVTVKVDGEDKTADYAESFGLQAADGKYYLTGTTDTQADIGTLAQEKMPEGKELKSSSVLTGKIAADGSLSLSVEYATLEYEVTFDTGSEQAIGAQTVKHGSLAEDPQFAKAGYTAKWQKDGADFTFDTPITANTELKLVLTPNTDTKYYVTVKVDGEDKTADYAEAFGLQAADGKYYLTGTTDTQADIAAKAEEAVRTGYHVAETSVVSGNIAGDESLALTVEYAVNQYTIVYSAGGGSGTMNEQTVAYGEESNLTANAFTKKHYTFNGWKSGTETFTNEQQIMNLSEEDGARIEMVAQWSQDGSLVRASFDVATSAEGQKLSAASGTSGTFIALHKEGQTFADNKGKSFITDLIDAIQPGDTLTVSITMAAEEYSSGYFEAWNLDFFPLQQVAMIPNRLLRVKYGSTMVKYEDGTSVTVTNSYSRSYAFSITFDPYDTAKIKADGGLKFRIAEAGHQMTAIIYGISVNKYLSNGLVEDFEGGTSFSYKGVGAMNGEDTCGLTELEAGRAGESMMYFEGSPDNNNGWFVIYSDVLKAAQAGGKLSLDAMFSGTGSNFYGATYEDVDVEVYACYADNEYLSREPLKKFNIKDLEWYNGTWRTVSFALTAEQAAAIAEAGGIAVRIKFNAPASDNLFYRLLIDNVSVTVGDASYEIASTAETVQADIAADIAEKFAGCYYTIESVTESEGKYAAQVKLSKDGMLDQTITLTYTIV